MSLSSAIKALSSRSASAEHVWQIARLGDRDTLKALIEAARTDGLTWQLIEALGPAARFDDECAKEAADIILASLPNEKLFEDALAALARIGYASSVEPMLPALKSSFFSSSPWTYRAVALVALGRSRHEAAIEPLAKAI